MADDRKLAKTYVPGIYRKGKRYVAIVRVRGKQQKLYAATLQEAREKKAQLVADVSRGEYRASAASTFGEYAGEWIDNYTGRTSRGFRESTRSGYRFAVEKATPFFDKRCKRLSDVEPVDVYAYIRWLFDPEKQDGRALSDSTVRNHVAAVRALFGTATSEGVLRHNPAQGVRISRQGKAAKPKKDIKALERAELAKLLQAIPEEWRLLFDTLLATGTRIGELAELRWGDVEFGDPTLIHITRRFYKGDIDEPKSVYGTRSIPVGKALSRRLWARQAAADELVFPNPKKKAGEALDQDHVRKHVLAPAKKAAGVEWATLHTLRHTAATLLFAEGRNLKQVQMFLGHHKPSFTLETYVHLLEEEGVGGPLEFDSGATPGATQPTETDRNELAPNAPKAQQIRAAG